MVKVRRYSPKNIKLNFNYKKKVTERRLAMWKQSERPPPIFWITDTAFEDPSRAPQILYHYAVLTV